jgi:xanthine dehydrogenase accessory factor
MRDVATQVSQWQNDGLESAVARVVELHGFGGRRGGEALAINTAGDRAGTLLGGAATERVIEAARDLLATGSPATEVDVVLGDADAVAAGLACGGSAKVLIQSVASLPAGLWSSLEARVPVVLSTALDGSGRSDLDFDNALLGGGRSVNRLVEGDPRRFEEALVAPTRLAVVGSADLVGALRRQGDLLGWEVVAIDGRDDAVRVAATLQPPDALVVLSHDPEVDTPALSAGLRLGHGYVGALGSRHTQAARRERLRALGLSDAECDRIHGPVGLDLGARTPEEVALAICAEILAARSGRDAGSLHAGTGPING